MTTRTKETTMPQTFDTHLRSLRNAIIMLVLAVAIFAFMAGRASANTPFSRATCAALEFNMDRTEDGTTVTVFRNGQQVHQVRNDVFGQPVRFTIPSPDQTVAQTWRVTVVGYNGASPEFRQTVQSCVAATTTVAVTTTTAPATTTTAPATPTTVASATTIPAQQASTTVAVTTPPVPSAPVSVPPRPSVPTVTAPPVYELPATGFSTVAIAAALLGLASIVIGTLLVRRSRSAS